MKVAISSIIFQNQDMKTAFQIASDLGFEAIELWGGKVHLPSDVDRPYLIEIRNLAQHYGLKMIGVGSYIGNFSEIEDAKCIDQIEELKKYMEVISFLEIDWVRVSSGGPHAFKAKPEQYEKAAYWLQLASDIARSYRKRLVMEIHNGSLIETAEAAYHLLGLVDRSNLGVIHDAGNMFITDTDYGKESVQLLGDKIFHVHVKGEKRTTDPTLPGTFYNETKHGIELFQQALLEEGEVDHYPTLQALYERGYSGYITLESHAPYPYIERSVRDKREVERLLHLIQSEGRE
ncbi:Xylose isomerase domain-containing protein TIM barrel [[Clostridium] ultunense Esp]|nr:Xylose isomerase domain-containing protein TIM barrel [[Clostridium] ultunense Esp]